MVFSNRDQRTLLDKLALLFLSLASWFQRPLLLVADADDASRKVIAPLLEHHHHLITRLRRNALAYAPVPKVKNRRSGRPRVYGNKIRLKSTFRNRTKFTTVESPVYGETGVQIACRCADLLWRPIGQRVRFVLVIHPTRREIILMATDTTLDPLTIVALYGYRFKIEVSFKQAIHTLGTYAYRFWMMEMTPIRKPSGDQYLHHESAAYRSAVRRKIEAYHRYVQLGCVAQGLLQHLAINFTTRVWDAFRGWLRTMKPDLAPSEAVVAQALGTSLFDFLALAPKSHHPFDAHQN